MSKLILKKINELTDNFDNQRIPLSVKQRSSLKKKYRYYGAQGIIDYVDDYIFDGEYLLVAEDGENLKSQKNNICNYVTGKFWVNNHAHIIKAKGNNNTKYLYYALNLVNFRNYVTGSAQPKLTKDNLGEIVLHVHPGDEQERISRVLSVIDRKIELNNRINTELEAMAKTLYDYWFVQFDFPDANGKPYKTSGGKMVYNLELKREIPENWHACELRSLIDMEYGKSLKADSRTGYGYPVFGSSGIVDFHDNYLVEGPGIVIGRKGTIGKVNYVFDNFYPIDTTYYVKSKNEASMIFLTFLLSSLGMEKMNSDSAVPGLNREAALSLPIVNIPLVLINKFHDHAGLWFKKKQLILEENNKLIKLRDWLLPMLMNGQVTVKS
ncbi:restriction endonuclease subunit S [Xenorhabdus stockiae]|uniref:restriction endonuclease subunit S n=1 Tax=Xenorhabdus stockiae TaxID=351614 RepID=UPI004063F76C